MEQQCIKIYNGAVYTHAISLSLLNSNLLDFLGVIRLFIDQHSDSGEEWVTNVLDS